MSHVRIFQSGPGGSSRAKPSLDAPSADASSSAAVIEGAQEIAVSGTSRGALGERIDDRLLRLEVVPGNGVWAKRRAIGEGNRLGLIRGANGSSYVIQTRVPIEPVQEVRVLDRSRDKQSELSMQWLWPGDDLEREAVKVEREVAGDAQERSWEEQIEVGEQTIETKR